MEEPPSPQRKRAQSIFSPIAAIADQVVQHLGGDEASPQRRQHEDPDHDQGFLAVFQDNMVDMISAWSGKRPPDYTDVQELSRENPELGDRREHVSEGHHYHTEQPPPSWTTDLLSTLSSKISKFSVSRVLDQVSQHKLVTDSEEQKYGNKPGISHIKRPTYDSSAVNDAIMRRRAALELPRLTNINPSEMVNKIQQMLDGNGIPFDENVPWIVLK